MKTLLMGLLVLLPGCEITIRFAGDSKPVQGDPLRNFSAKEANEMLEQFETPPKPRRKVLKQVRPWTQIEGMIDDGFEWVYEDEDQR